MGSVMHEAMAAVMEPWVQAFHRCPLISALNEAWHVLHVARRSESTENTESDDLLTCSQGGHWSLLELIFLIGITQSAVRNNAVNRNRSRGHHPRFWCHELTNEDCGVNQWFPTKTELDVIQLVIAPVEQSTADGNQMSSYKLHFLCPSMSSDVESVQEENSKNEF